MTTYVSARDALINTIHTSLSSSMPTMKLFYENTTHVDMDSVGDKFIRIEVDFLDAEQSDIDMDLYDPNIRPGERVYGEVVFQVFVKEGLGTRETLSIFDALRALLSVRSLTGVNIGACKPGKKEARSGWHCSEFIAPFSFYSKY